MNHPDINFEATYAWLLRLQASSIVTLYDTQRLRDLAWVYQCRPHKPHDMIAPLIEAIRPKAIAQRMTQ